VLSEIGRIIESMMRETDRAARLGGDEFGVALGEADSAAGERVAKRIIDAVRELGTKYPGSGLGASAGHATRAPGLESPDTLIQAADEAMYRVKRSGKGRSEASLRQMPGA
jgi:diguanylate cyclase (GGDEF)-like protein